MRNPAGVVTVSQLQTSKITANLLCVNYLYNLLQYRLLQVILYFYHKNHVPISYANISCWIKSCEGKLPKTHSGIWHFCFPDLLISNCKAKQKINFQTFFKISMLHWNCMVLLSIILLHVVICDAKEKRKKNCFFWDVSLRFAIKGCHILDSFCRRQNFALWAPDCAPLNFSCSERGFIINP